MNAQDEQKLVQKTIEDVSLLHKSNSIDLEWLFEFSKSKYEWEMSRKGETNSTLFGYTTIIIVLAAGLLSFSSVYTNYRLSPKCLYVAFSIFYAIYALAIALLIWILYKSLSKYYGHASSALDAVKLGLDYKTLNDTNVNSTYIIKDEIKYAIISQYAIYSSINKEANISKTNDNQVLKKVVIGTIVIAVLVFTLSTLIAIKYDKDKIDNEIAIENISDLIVHTQASKEEKMTNPSNNQNQTPQSNPAPQPPPRPTLGGGQVIQEGLIRPTLGGGGFIRDAADKKINK